MNEPALVVVGIGADGWAGLGEDARAAVLGAEVIVGSRRQLALLPPTSATHRQWPSPIDGLVDELCNGAGPATCVLASGDPMLHGIGATLARRLGPSRVLIHPHPSAFAIACARLGWPEAEAELVSAVGRPVDVLARSLQTGRRLVVYVPGADGANGVARVLRQRGFGESRMIVLEQLGGAAERMTESTAAQWADCEVGELHCVAVECRAQAGRALARTPGLPDDAYEHDGQLTKRAVRAVTLALLEPSPGQLLWDIGAGSGSIGIEWLRAEPTARAVAIETRADRAERAARNALSLGVPELVIRRGEAPEALAGLPEPDAIFIGGGLTSPALVARCWEALRPGGRLVANAVTFEGEAVLVAARAECGGELTRIDVSHAGPVGSFTAWRPQLPIVQWSVRKEPA